MFRNLSLLSRLSLIFFAFTVVNIVLFWLATGSNQMRLIAERASLEMHRDITNIEQKLQILVRGDAQKQKVDFYRTPSAVSALQTIFQNKQNQLPTDLLEYNVITNSNSVLLNFNSTKSALGADELQNLIKALRLREFSSETFYSSPDVLLYRLTVYLPFVSEGGQDLILRVVFKMTSMEQELARFLRIGASIVGLLLLIQFGLGFFLYRLIVRPLKELRLASHITGRGDYHQLAGYEKRGDELGALIGAFNKMSTDIRDQKEIIAKNLAELKQRDDTMQHELMIAQNIQKSIFPRGDYPHKYALEYKPLFAVSGDFYDVYRFADGSVGYLICDASGHGVPAALLTMMAKSAFTTYASQLTDPGAIISQANKHISGSLELTGQYLTAFFARISGTSFEYCNATHPEPIILQPAGMVQRLKSNGFYVGMMADTPFEFETEKLELASGTKIILYTDGITEARNAAGELFSVQRLADIAERERDKTPEAIRDIILLELKNYIGNIPIDDDLTLLVLEI